MRKCPAILPDALRIYDVPESRLFSRGRYSFDCETKCRWSILYHKSANINKWSQLDAWSPKTETTGDGSFFIDRDGTHFRFLVNYLRNGELILPEGATFLKELEAEAKFYQLQGILDALKPKEPFEESVILTNEEHRRVLKNWLPEAMKGEYRLLFRASRDGFAASTFHFQCDNEGPTVAVVKSGGNIFGGFTEKPWASEINWYDSKIQINLIE